jgi:putative membrane protein
MSGISQTGIRFSRHAAAWVLIAAYLAMVVAFAWDPTPFAQVLAAIGIASAIVHAILNYGARHALVLFLTCLVITLTVETIGVATGVPFGRYHFEVGARLSHVATIPIILGPMWFGMGYFSWIVAGTLLGGAERRPTGRFTIIVLPVVAAFVMTQWDLVMDAPASTISHAWIWHDGGAYFGVPLTNYFGWLLTSWLLYQSYAVYLSRQHDLPQQTTRQSQALRLAAIMFYLGSGLTHVTPWLLRQSGDVTDASGQVWHVGDVRAATVLVMLFTMFFTSMLAAIRLAGDDLRS